MNVRILWDILKLLRGKKTKLILYTYDSFLFDFSEEELKTVIEDIQQVFKKYKLNIKIKQGYDYDFRQGNPNMYNTNYDVVTDIKILGDLNNKLFCTFTDLDNLDELDQNEIKSKYTIIYNKLFVLEIVGKDEYVITYNVDQGNVHTIPENTILVHRKKESNTLYTINALNELIKKLKWWCS